MLINLQQKDSGILPERIRAQTRGDVSLNVCLASVKVKNLLFSSIGLVCKVKATYLYADV